MLSIIWTIVIGFVAGVIAKLLHPGRSYEPSGFIMTTVLGIVGAFVATYLGQAVGWYKAVESAGFIGAIVGAIIILELSHLVYSGPEITLRTPFKKSELTAALPLVASHSTARDRRVL